MSSEKVIVGLVQMPCGEDAQGNVARALSGIRAAAGRGAQIVCTQELFRTRYFCQTEDAKNFDLAEPIPGPTTEQLQAVAKELGVVVVGSLFERRAAGLYHNTAVIIDANGSPLGTYRKMHIPDDPLYYEKYHFTPGDTGFRAWKTRFGTIGVLICWDQWYPEAARLTALAGADILLYPTAIGWHDAERKSLGDTQHDSWETIQRSHGIANGVYVCSVNRVGREGTVQFWGQSFVSDPAGRVLHRASVDQEEIVIQELDLGLIEEQRRGWPFLRDRRIDAYGGITERFGE